MSDPDLPDEFRPPASLRGAGFADADTRPPAPREADRNAWLDNYRQLSRRSHPNIAATARHLVEHLSVSSFDTTPEPLPAALAQANSLTMG